MAIWMLLLAGVMRWFAKIQHRPGPRAAFNWLCVGCFAYIAWLLYYEPERAWQVRWVGREIRDAILRVLDRLIP